MSGNLAGKIHHLLKQARVCCAFFLIIPAIASAEWYQQHRDIMGTRVTAELWHEDIALTADCGERVFAEMRRIDALMSSYKADSELSRINAKAASETVEISTEMAALIKKSLYFSKLSNGVFDITYASIGHRYDYRKGLRPNQDTVEKILPSVDYRHIELKDRRVRFLHDNVKIDLGGIAKGYAVDRAVAIVRQCGIETALISAGGDSRILGDRRGRAWMIGIKHPRAEESIALRVPLSDSAISTSGDYERFFIDDGERVHHIINPRTGKSAQSSWSATVTGPDTMATDALSTTIFIMGAVDGIALIERLEGIDAIIIDAHGKVHYSSGFVDPDEES